MCGGRRASQETNITLDIKYHKSSFERMEHRTMKPKQRQEKEENENDIMKYNGISMLNFYL